MQHFDAVESSDDEPTGSQHCDTTENRRNVPLTSDATEGELCTDHELQEGPDLPQDDCSSRQIQSTNQNRYELGQQRAQRVRHPPQMFTYPYIRTDDNV